MKYLSPCAKKRNYHGDEKIKSMVNAHNIDAISIETGTAHDFQSRK
jgi:hypothetical protein